MSTTASNSSVRNLLLNVILFLLATVIIYISYSIYVKLSGKEAIHIESKSTEVPSDIIQVEVLNGCGVSGIAERFTDYLRSKGVDVVKIDNYYRFDIDKTICIDRTGNRANAIAVAELLGVKKRNVMQEINEDYFLEVSVVIGKDYFGLLPIK